MSACSGSMSPYNGSNPETMSRGLLAMGPR
jgi:hypothetical protein